MKRKFLPPPRGITTTYFYRMIFLFHRPSQNLPQLQNPHLKQTLSPYPTRRQIKNSTHRPFQQTPPPRHRNLHAHQNIPPTQSPAIEIVILSRTLSPKLPPTQSYFTEKEKERNSKNFLTRASTFHTTISRARTSFSIPHLPRPSTARWPKNIFSA